MMSKKSAFVLISALVLVGMGLTVGHGNVPAAPEIPSATRAVLTVATLKPERRSIPVNLTANGSVAAWQEAIIGAELGGIRLGEVRVQVGDAVRKGQVLAVFDDERINVEVAQGRAALAEAEANLADARRNGDRARGAGKSGAMSDLQIHQFLTAEKTAEAKLAAAKAQLDVQLWRWRHLQVVANDDGVISARSATLGAVPVEGQELFRLIRQNRLEWRGEVTAPELLRLKPGLEVAVEVPGAARTVGRVRSLGPTVDGQNRNALVYVDLPDAARKGFRPGMFARGEFHLGRSEGLTVPMDALSLRDGFSFVFRVARQSGDQAKVELVKVRLGRRIDDRSEVVAGLGADDRLVASGGSFLADGDTVKVLPP